MDLPPLDAPRSICQVRVGRRTIALQRSAAAARRGQPDRVAGLTPPVEVALARPVDHLPTRDVVYEPKYDGWRGVLFAGGGFLYSRQGRPLSDRFPEVISAASTLDHGVVLDGELVALREGAQPRLEFGALSYSPVRRRAEHILVRLMVFDLLGIADQDLRGRPYSARREALITVLGPAWPQIQLVPSTSDRDTASAWLTPVWGDVGIEGALAKPPHSHYLPGYRSGWLKIRTRYTAEAVVLGVAAGSALVVGRRGRTGGWWATGLTVPVPQSLRTDLATRLHPTGARPARHTRHHLLGR